MSNTLAEATETPALEELEWSRWEWPAVASVQDLWQLRTGALRLIWTPVEEVEGFVLNLLAPIGMIFWDFGADYAPFAHGAWEFAAAECAKEGSARRLADLCMEVGIEPRSFTAGVVYRGLTAAHGNRFFPETTDPDHFLMTQRHVSVAVPASCRSSVSRYFHRQIVAFDSRTFRELKEDAFVYGDDEPDATSLEFRHSIWRSSATDRRELRRRIDACNGCWQAPLHPHYATRGASLMLPQDATLTADELVDFEVVTRFRVATMLSHGTLHSLQNMRGQAIASGGWDALELADLREEVLGALDARLAGFPIVQIDPYAQWRSTNNRHLLQMR